jgi:DNA-binding GntR family transcriptional regulator
MLTNCSVVAMNAPSATVFKPFYFSLREQIAERIRTDVLCGRIAEGERLSEAKLGERFGVSRRPVREALQQLMHEGLLEGRPNTGVKVASAPPDAMCELIMGIRQMIETFAVRSFLDHLEANDFAHWDAILERMRVACMARDFAAIAEHDIEFHRSIVRRAQQRDLESIWTSLVGRVHSHFRETHCEYADALEIYDEHVRIVETFRGGDVETAVALLQENQLAKSIR